jgi:hypothetical protein
MQEATYEKSTPKSTPIVVDISCGLYFPTNPTLRWKRCDGRASIKVEKTSGVWVDGGYVGYLGELKGSKKVLLLPGEHVITVRQDGYQDFTERFSIRFD